MPSQFFVKRANFATVCSCVFITLNLVCLVLARVKLKNWICFVAAAVSVCKMVMTSISLPAVCCYLNCCYLLESVVLDLLFIVCVQTRTMPSAVFHGPCIGKAILWFTEFIYCASFELFKAFFCRF